jgi:hypothetical protein
MVVYGLTDAEGMVVCEQMKSVLGQKYEGRLVCIAPSGG